MAQEGIKTTAILSRQVEPHLKKWQLHLGKKTTGGLFGYATEVLHFINQNHPDIIRLYIPLFVEKQEATITRNRKNKADYFISGYVRSYEADVLLKEVCVSRGLEINQAIEFGLFFIGKLVPINLIPASWSDDDPDMPKVLDFLRANVSF